MIRSRTLANTYVVTKEMGDWGTDPDSGSFSRKLTNPPAWCHNIYCEQPYCSPDGNRLVIVRTIDFFSPTRQLIVADLQNWCLTLIEPEIYEMVAHSPWSEWVYYQIKDGSLRRLSLTTLERQEVLPPGMIPKPPVGTISSMSPDNKTLLMDEAQSGGGFTTCMIDLQSAERTVIAHGPGNRNPHGQFDRRPDDPHTLLQYFTPGEHKIQLLVRSRNTGKQAMLPVGGKWCAESSGHMAWIGLTGKVACALEWDQANRKHDPRHPLGNVAIAGPNDTKPHIFQAPEHALYHVSVSKCGTYFVGDDYMDFKADSFNAGMPGPVRIVVGNIKTGKYRTLLKDCQNHGNSGSSRHEPTPYFTADNKHVIYNASPFGVMQVFATTVPEAFLKSLD